MTTFTNVFVRPSVHPHVASVITTTITYYFVRLSEHLHVESVLTVSSLERLSLPGSLVSYLDN